MVKIFVISETSRTPEVGRANPVDATLTTGAAFQVNNAKPCIPVFTLSINDTFKFLEHLKQEFRRKTYWSKYISEIKKKKKKKKNATSLIQHLKTLIDCLYFVQKCDDPIRNPFDEYYVPLAKIKDFNALTDKKLLFD